MFAGRLRKLAFSSVAALARGARSRTAEGSLQCNVFSHELDILKPAGLASQSRSYFNGPRGGYVHFAGRTRQTRDQRRMVLIAIGGGGFLVFYVTHREEVPYTHRKHAVFVSPETEMVLGLETFKQLRAEAEAAGRLLAPYHPATKMVRKIGLRIAEHAADPGGGGRTDHMKGLEWEFVVINEPGNVNAMVMPGGKVVVYTGLLKMLHQEDEIAAVLGHEVAHVLARHIGEKLSSAALITMVQIGLALMLGFSIPSDLFQLAIFLPNSRKQETEADVIGIHLSARACFDPRAAVVVFTKLGEAEKSAGVSIPKFLRTHPMSTERVEAIKRNLPKALEDYELAGCNAPRALFSW